MQKLAIIAGAGDLPVLMAKIAQSKGIAPLIILLDNRPDDDFAALPTARFALTQIESIIGYLKQEAVDTLLMAGKVARPSMSDNAQIDDTSAKLLQTALPQGDDAALRAVLGVLQQAGITVIPLQALTSDQCLPHGYDNQIGINPSDESLTLAIKAHKRLGGLDVGQSVMVQAKRILAIEAAEGTDEMIARAASLIDPAQPALFFKASKSAQAKHLDTPVIGLATLQACQKAGVGVIAIEAEHCLLAAPINEIEAYCATHQLRLVSVTITSAQT